MHRSIRAMGALFMAPFLCLSVLAQVSMNVDLLYNWNDTTIPDNGFGATYNEIWGFVQGGQEYAVIGSTLGTHICQITSTDELIEVDMIPGAFQGPVVHRDYHDHAGFLYAICQQGTSTLQIADLQYLPDSVHLVYDSDTLFARAHNIFIDTAAAKLYVCGPDGHAMSVYSLADPIDPQFEVHFDEVDYVHDCFVRNDTAYLNAAGQGLHVYDFVITTAPQLLGSLTSYLDQGYNHSGWLSEDGLTYVFADETQGMRMKVSDVSDLTDITVLSLFNSEQDSLTVPHNLMLKQQRVYVSHYNDGLQIFDISDRTLPQKVGFYDTYLGPDTSSNFKGAWGIYAFLPSGRLLISDRQTGIYLFHFNDPTASIGEPGQAWRAGLYPNPNDGQFQVVFDRSMPALRILISDATGRQVRSFDHVGGVSASLDVSGLPAGLYLTTILDGTGRQVLPFVIR